jgi:phage tail-like protein
MPLPEIDTSYGFVVEVDGVAVAGVREVDGLAMRRDLVEHKQQGPDGKYVVRRLPGRWKAGEVTVTRALTEDTTFESWLVDSRLRGTNGPPMDVAISIVDFEGQVTRRFELVAAWPVRLEVGPLKAGVTSVLTESLTIAFERFTTS